MRQIWTVPVVSKGENMLKDSRFTEIDEEFICEHCGKKVEKLGYSCRNHCNYCLYSKHVDVNPVKSNAKGKKRASLFSTHPSIDDRIEALQNIK